MKCIKVSKNIQNISNLIILLAISEVSILKFVYVLYSEMFYLIIVKCFILLVMHR